MGFESRLATFLRRPNSESAMTAVPENVVTQREDGGREYILSSGIKEPVDSVLLPDGTTRTIDVIPDDGGQTATVAMIDQIPTASFPEGQTVHAVWFQWTPGMPGESLSASRHVPRDKEGRVFLADTVIFDPAQQTIQSTDGRRIEYRPGNSFYTVFPPEKMRGNK